MKKYIRKITFLSIGFSFLLGITSCQSDYLGTVVKRIKLYNELIANVI